MQSHFQINIILNDVFSSVFFFQILYCVGNQVFQPISSCGIGTTYERKLFLIIDEERVIQIACFHKSIGKLLVVIPFRGIVVVDNLIVFIIQLSLFA